MASAHQRFHMVTQHGDLLNFHCKHPSSSGSEVLFWLLSFNQESGTFIKKKKKITFMYENSARAVSIVHVTTAVDVKTRQRVVCILMRLHRKGSHEFKYMLYSLSSKTRAVLHVKFSLPYKIGEDVFILRGPTLLWSHKGFFFYTSAESVSVKEVPVHLKVNFLGELPLSQRQLAIVGSQKMTEDEKVGNDKEDQVILYYLEDGRIFSADCILPSAYSLVTQCMLVLSAQEVAGSLKSTVVAATCRRQLVWFENGLPKQVCLLPYEEPRNIQIVHTGSSCVIVVVFEHRNICAVWQDTFKVAACWTDVHLLLVDDFVGAGFEQMLLLFEEVDSADGIPGKFLLTDLCGINYSTGKAESGDVNRCKVAEENVTLTIQALEARLQSGLTILQDLQRDLHVKDHVIQRCVLALHDLLADQNHVASPALQEGLVSLLDEQSEKDECTSQVSMEMNSDESFLKVERSWHRVIGQMLVFGALLTPANQMMDLNMIAALIATPPTVQSVNKIIFYPEPLTPVAPGPPNNKRMKYPSGPAILIVTELAPLLTFGPINCSGLLCFSMETAGSASQHCKLVNIDLKGAVEGTFQPHLLEDCSIDSDESREDLLSLMVAFKSWGFHIISTDLTVMDVSLFLKEKFRAKQIKICPQYLLCSSTQLSGAMLFNWIPCSSFHGMLDVYCSNHLDLLHFMDTLCNFLPVSHSVKLFKTGQSRNKNPALLLAHEICMIKEAMAVLINSGAEDLRRDLEKTINLKMVSDVAMLVESVLDEY